MGRVSVGDFFLFAKFFIFSLRLKAIDSVKFFVKTLSKK